MAGGWPVGASEIAKMRAHWRLVMAWQRRCNLTAVVDEEQAAWLHYGDSVRGLAHLQAGPIADIGAGAGFPGLVLAICRPDWQFTLLEPRRRRASFLAWAAAELGLANVQVAAQRVEQAPPPAGFAHAVTRAALATPQWAASALTWLVPGGTLVRYCGAEAAGWGGTPHGYRLDPPGGPPRIRRLEVLARAC